MRVETAQHVTHHAGGFDWPGTVVAIGAAKTQAHARHGVQNAPLYGLLAIAHIGQGAAFDDAERVFKVGALGVGGQVELVVGLGGG